MPLRLCGEWASLLNTFEVSMTKNVHSLVYKQNSPYAWLLAARPKTLVASPVPVLCAVMLAFAQGSPIQWILLISALFASIFIQVATNLINDTMDFFHGKDTGARLGPVRATQSGLLSARQVYWGGIAAFTCAFFVSIPLLVAGGFPVLGILIASVLAGYCYTAGPYPLAYHGLGDLFVLIFFGWVITGGVYYLQTGTLDFQAVLLGTQMGLLATTLIAINNFRDIKEDAQTGKKTLAVRFGPLFARIEITTAALLPFFLNGYWILQGYYNACLFSLFALPIACRLVQKIWTHPPSPLYNQFLAQGSFLQLSFGILISLGLIFS
jgi:1,4-dihydroxy-2-naphthoate polyprenyltransferase